MLRHLIAVMIVLTLAVAPDIARAACEGRNLLEQIKAENPQAYAEIEAEARAIPNGEAMFWRIEKPGVGDSFLLGTVHVSDPRITNLSDEVLAGLGQSRVIALELAEIRDKQVLAKAMMRHARLMAMPLGQTLWDVVPDAEEDAIRNSPNLPAGRGAVISAYQPWVVAMMLSIPLCEQQRRASGALSLDELIGRTAVEHGKELVGLETIEEQLGVLASMNLENQVDFLVATARIGEQMVDYFETMIGLYVDRQINTLLPLSKRLEGFAGGNAEIFAFMERELIERRNATMHRATLGLLKDGSAFIAVGALHLPGEKGLVALIRNAGYTVTPIN